MRSLMIMLAFVASSSWGAELIYVKLGAVKPSGVLVMFDQNGNTLNIQLAGASIPVHDQAYAERSRAIIKAQLGSAWHVFRQTGVNSDLHRGSLDVSSHDFNLELIKRGHAWVEEGAAIPLAYKQAETAAMAAKLGLHATPGAVRPHEWLKQKRVAQFADKAADAIRGHPETLNAVYVADSRTKLYYPFTCPNAATIPAARRQVFMHFDNLATKGFAPGPCR